MNNDSSQISKQPKSTLRKEWGRLDLGEHDAKSRERERVCTGFVKGDGVPRNRVANKVREL